MGYVQRGQLLVPDDYEPSPAPQMMEFFAYEIVGVVWPYEIVVNDDTVGSLDLGESCTKLETRR